MDAVFHFATLVTRSYKIREELVDRAFGIHDPETDAPRAVDLTFLVVDSSALAAKCEDTITTPQRHVLNEEIVSEVQTLPRSRRGRPSKGVFLKTLALMVRKAMVTEDKGHAPLSGHDPYSQLHTLKQSAKMVSSALYNAEHVAVLMDFRQALAASSSKEQSA